VRFQGFEFRAARVQGQRIVTVEIRPVRVVDGAGRARSGEPVGEAPAP
jgi:hypothetical protein